MDTVVDQTLAQVGDLLASVDQDSQLFEDSDLDGELFEQERAAGPVATVPDDEEDDADEANDTENNR